MENIQLFKPLFRIDECLAEIKECLEKGWTGIGFKTVEMETKWKEYTKLPFAHFLNSATAGLHLAVKILKDKYGWADGDEIITSPLTFVSTNHAILYENMKPIFADVAESLNISPKSVKSKIGKKTKAIMFVGMGGNADNLLEIIQIAREHDLKVILDAAHMGGTKIDGRHVGFDVDVSVFSFQAVKNLPTADSGMICFADGTMDKVARELAWMGINKDTFSRSNSKGTYKWAYDVNEVGYKYHGNSVIAALGIVGLKYLDEDNKIRRQLVEKYMKFLKNETEIRIIEHNNCESSRHLFQVLVENREMVLTRLNACGIYPGVHYRTNTDYKPYLYAKDSCPQASYFSERLLSLPMHMELTDEHISYISKSLINSIK